MRNMSGGPCLHYDCSNRNSFGYCKTTACINEHYQREQWSLSTTNKSESVVIKQQTNADKIRSMSDEELAGKIGKSIDCEVCKTMHHSESGECPSRTHQSCVDFWLDWLKQKGEQK